MLATDTIEHLKQANPYPATKPDVPPDNHGWFDEDRYGFLEYLNADQKLIVELGSWLGKSTRFILENSPNACVVAVDHWLGSDVHQDDARVQDKLPTLYETFIVNCWEHRNRLVPLKMNTIEGLHEVAKHGCQPDLIFIDASHRYDDVLKDLEETYRLFPESTICGDDWCHTLDNRGVRRAVKDFTKAHGLSYTHNKNFWCLRPSSLLGSIKNLVYGLGKK